MTNTKEINMSDNDTIDPTSSPDAPITDACSCRPAPEAVHQRGDEAFCLDHIETGAPTDPA